MLSGEENGLALMVRNARELVECGYYSVLADGDAGGGGRERGSLVESMRASAEFPIVAEVKLASPTAGRLAAHLAEELIDDYIQGGATGLSVITEPRHFLGSLRYLEMAARTGSPVLMKDFIIDQEQVMAAARLGASAVLLIQGVFDYGLSEERDALISTAHRLGLEVVLESSNLMELESALSSGADVLGYNRRDLRTFRPGPWDTTEALDIIRRDGRPSLLMSLMRHAEDVRWARDLGASGVLVGSSLSGSACPKEKLRSLRVPR